jgi:hypothetical protein
MTISCASNTIAVTHRATSGTAVVDRTTPHRRARPNRVGRATIM